MSLLDFKYICITSPCVVSEPLFVSKSWKGEGKGKGKEKQLLPLNNRNIKQEIEKSSTQPPYYFLYQWSFNNHK